MFSNNVPLTDCGSGIDYILSPCSLVADGLVKMMAEGGMQPVVLPSDTLAIPAGVDIRRIVVFLPDTPCSLLSTLRQAGSLLAHAITPLPMLILSRSPACWLWYTLLHQVPDRQRLCEVYAAASDLPVSCLAALLQEHIFGGYPSLEQLSEEEIQVRGKPSGGLTRPELSAILGLLSGHSASIQAKHRGISHKTLYTQRTTGLKKMVEHHPQLAVRFPGSQIKGQKKQSIDSLSAFEREFVHAIHCRQVFPVFQPITNEHMQVKGMEVLSRWHRHGDVLLPGDFLPQVRSEYAWLVLTAFVIQEAIQNINKYQGEYFFSVNIPAAVASNNNLTRMMETARRQLNQPSLSDRLVLEFAENMDFNRHGKIADNIGLLRQRGFRIALDDCFSKSSVIFPVRSVRFCAYKLDMSIVNDMQHDAHALTLIKSLLYYCRQTVVVLPKA